MESNSKVVGQTANQWAETCYKPLSCRVSLRVHYYGWPPSHCHIVFTLSFKTLCKYENTPGFKISTACAHYHGISTTIINVFQSPISLVASLHQQPGLAITVSTARRSQSRHNIKLITAAVVRAKGACPIWKTWLVWSLKYGRLIKESNLQMTVRERCCLLTVGSWHTPPIILMSKQTNLFTV